MGACCRSHDRRDCQQWHALFTVIARGRGFSPWHRPHCISGRLRAVYKLDINPI